MNAKIGRNDPCPCGSGEKYKYCCMRKDRQRQRGAGSQPASQQERLDVLRSVTRDALPQAPPELASEIQRLQGMMEDMAAYEAMRDEIEAAVRILKPHRAEFKALMEDGQAAMTQADRLFSEEPFQPLRYTSQDVERAFQAVGYPALIKGEMDQADMEIIMSATLHLAGDEMQRMKLSRRLFMLLPEYVAAGRYMDAWLIQYSAYKMVEAVDQSNPFLFAMFMLGLQAWTVEMDDQSEAFMGHMDVDFADLAQMEFEEAQSWLKEHLTKPDRQARIEAYVNAHPRLRGRMEAEAIRLEQEALELLERDDAQMLYLSRQELAPWLATLMERVTFRFGEMLKEAKDIAPDDLQALQKIFLDVSIEMAEAIFTPQRRDQFVAQLWDYGRHLKEVGERHAALAINLMAHWVGEEQKPSQNRFLVGVCLASLRQAGGALTEQMQESGEH